MEDSQQYQGKKGELKKKTTKYHNHKFDHRVAAVLMYHWCYMGEMPHSITDIPFTELLSKYLILLSVQVFLSQVIVLISLYQTKHCLYTAIIALKD